MSKTPRWHSWAGHVFENICLNHSGKIKQALGLGGVLTKDGHFRHYSKEEGAELERKKRVFQKVTGTKKTIFLTMITPFGVKENDQYVGVVVSS